MAAASSKKNVKTYEKIALVVVIGVLAYIFYHYIYSKPTPKKPEVSEPKQDEDADAKQTAGQAAQSFANAEKIPRVPATKPSKKQLKVVHTPVSGAPYAPALQDKKKYKDVMALQQEMLRATRGVKGYADSIAPMPELRKVNYIKT